VPLTDAQLKALIVDKSTWLTNSITGDKYMIIYSALGKGAAAKAIGAARRASSATGSGAGRRLAEAAPALGAGGGAARAVGAARSG